MQMLIWDNYRLSADEKTLQDYLHLTNPFKIKPDFLLHWYDERFGEFKKWSSSVVQFGFILWFGVICKCPFSAKYISMSSTQHTRPWGWRSYVHKRTKNSNLPTKSKFCNNSCRTKNVMSRRGFWDPWGFWVTLALVWFGLLQSELGKVWWVCFEMLIAWETQERRENSNFVFFCAHNWATPMSLAPPEIGVFFKNTCFLKLSTPPYNLL